MGVNVVLLGPPGAGKGTQAERLAASLGVPRVSTGDMLRDAVAAGTTLGQLVRAVMARGELVGDDVMIEVVRERCSRPDAAAGFVLDGFPRTLNQAVALDRLMDGQDSLTVLELVVPLDELVRRLSARRVCALCGANAEAAAPADARCARCGGALVRRGDDGAEVVIERQRIYERDTKPLVEHYRERRGFRRVMGTGAPDGVAAELAQAVSGAGR